MLSQITNKQIEILIKKTLKKKKRKKENPPESYPDEFCNTFKEGLIFTFLILLQGNWIEKSLPKTFYKASIANYQNQKIHTDTKET